MPIPVHIDGLIYERQPHGGISRYMTNLINGLASETKSRVTLYLPDGCAFPPGVNPVAQRSIPGPINLRPGRVFARLSSALAERRRSRFWSSIPDGVFHSSYYSSPGGVLVPQVLTMHDAIFEDYPELFNAPGHVKHVAEKRRAVERARGLIFPSRFAMSRANAHFDLGERLTRVVPHAVDPQFLVEPDPQAVDDFRNDITQGEPFLLHIGARYLHKNVGNLIKAFAGWQHRREFRLVLAGGGQLDAQEGALIDRLGARDRVLVLPQLSERGLLLAYNAADAFIFPSFSEGFGFPLLEAMACGCPAAVANAASLPEVGGSVPVYFEAMDIDSIRAGLDAVIRLGRADFRVLDGRSRARLRSWSDVAVEYYEFYRATAADAVRAVKGPPMARTPSVAPAPQANDSASVGVIIPAHNAQEFLERAIRSVFATGYPNLEVVVIDDGSTDQTFAVAKRVCAEFPGKCRLVQHEMARNLGVSVSRNLGVALSDSEWVVFLDADDYFLPNRFEALLRHTATPGSTVNAIYELAQVALDERGVKGWIAGEPGMVGVAEDLTGVDLLERVLEGQSWQVAAVTLRRSLLAASGLFDPGKRIAEDCHLWYRIAAVGNVVAGDLARPVSVYWRHTSNTYRYELENRLAVLKAMLDAGRWARDVNLPTERVAMFGVAASRYATRIVIAAREANQPKIVARVMAKMARAGNFNYVFGYEGMRQSWAVGRDFLKRRRR